ncbi:MAG: trypsin-like peptidase domain-containing protein [Spirochaetia bacterium]|nr:trypsin-like peptidase domain-containing protein [Spirochaetia bacterium]
MKRIVFLLVACILILSSCRSTAGKDKGFVLERDPDVAGYFADLLEQGFPFLTIQEIYYLESNGDQSYDKARAAGVFDEYLKLAVEKGLEQFNSAIANGDFDRALSIYFSFMAMDRSDLLADYTPGKLYLMGADYDAEKGNYVTALYRFYKYLLMEKPTSDYLVKYGDIAVRQNNRYMLSVINSMLPDGKKKNEYREVLSTVDTPAKMMDGTVTVWVNRGTKLQSGYGVPDRTLGSGFFIDKRGYIITNYHVIESEVNPEYEGFSKLFIRLDDTVGTKVPAKVVGYDPIFDVALLKTEIEPDYIFSFSLNNDYSPGDRIYAIGSPGGLENTITAGIVSAGKRRFLQLGDVLQMDVPVNPGNSGGPLINNNNEVLGIVFAGMLRFQGVNFAIPSHWVMDLMSGLYKEEGQISHCWMGLSMYEKKDRLEVIYAMPGEPANMAGMKSGDILKKINGIECHTISQVHKIFNSVLPDTLLSVEWERDGKVYKNLIATKKRPQKAFDIAMKKDSKKNVMLPLFGMEVESTGNYIFSEGYVITKVYPGLPAAEADLSINDPFALKGWKYDPKNRFVAMQIYVKKKKAGFMESVLQLVAYLDDNNLI